MVSRGKGMGEMAEMLVKNTRSVSSEDVVYSMEITVNTEGLYTEVNNQVR